ncbi:hypothetical protein QCA50_007931 [Cerrena zonata]|uniref:Uncharacterized protein n=1 Tax=Cerrena zonata TaxID=2478898 RepID=A0AAW0GDL5_9APHY
MSTRYSKQCNTLLYLGDDVRCTRRIRSDTFQCYEHRLEYEASRKKYKAHSENAKFLFNWFSTFCSVVERLHSTQEIEDMLLLVDRYIGVVRMEMEGRETHRLRFIGEGDAGHNIWMKKLERDCEWGYNKSQALYSRLNEIRRSEGLSSQVKGFAFTGKESVALPKYDAHYTSWTTETDSSTRHHSFRTVIVGALYNIYIFSAFIVIFSTLLLLDLGLYRIVQNGTGAYDDWSSVPVLFSAILVRITLAWITLSVTMKLCAFVVGIVLRIIRALISAMIILCIYSIVIVAVVSVVRAVVGFQV